MTPPHDSFWVIPGRLLAGPYPGSTSPDEAAQKVRDLEATGVTLFVDLTEDHELEPYAECCARARHVRLPIRDVDIPTEARMREIIETIREGVERGDVVYVHCWGGVGRTGTVIGCFMREDGLDPPAVLERIRELRTGTERAHRASPETSAQRDFIARWKPSPTV
jgi:protein-tyrosine phosphatase